MKLDFHFDKLIKQEYIKDMFDALTKDERQILEQHERNVDRGVPSTPQIVAAVEAVRQAAEKSGFTTLKDADGAISLLLATPIEAQI